MEIIPAVIPESRDHLEAVADRVKPHSSHLQIDVTDGIFVKTVSWPYAHNGDLDARLPHADEVEIEIDLMVYRPHEVVSQWIEYGAKRIVVHIESLTDPETFIADFRKKHPKAALIFALNIDTKNEAVEKYIPLLDGVQCMGIANIGYQGEPFDERVLGKIEALHRAYPMLPISVDGGASFESAPQLRRVGVSRLVAGSVILSSDDIPGTIRMLKES